MNLNVEKILIIGLGMIGSSIALASKSKGIEVYGFDKSNNSIKDVGILYVGGFIKMVADSSAIEGVLILFYL